MMMKTTIARPNKRFWKNGDWELIERAMQKCRAKNEVVADKLSSMCIRLENGETVEEVKAWGERNLLEPLGLNVPVKDTEAT